MISADLRRALFHKWPIRVRNSSGVVAPPGACMRIASAVAVDGELVFTCAKPNATQQNRYLVNGPFEIGTGSSDEGIASALADPGYVMYDTGSPAVNEEWGPEDGEWALTTSGTGFTISGGTTTLAGNTVVSAVQGISGTSPVAEIIQLNHATATAGDIVAANASGLHPGRIKEWNGSSYDNGDAVWLLLTDYYDVDAGAVIGEHGKFYGPAKLAGTFDVSSDVRPLYIAHVGDQTFIGKPDASIAKAASGTVSLWHRATEADSTLNVTAQALGAAVTIAKYVTVQRINGQWYVGCWET